MGNRTQHLQEAAALIGQQAGKVIKASALYETAPWGNVQQPDYLNQALQISTPLSPLPLLHTLLKIERDIGRIRQEKWGARVIDIDIIFYDDQVISLPELKLPHPRMQHRQFVLVPLNEILPDWEHPVLHQPIRTLLANCKDESPVRKLAVSN
ncbi:2-amino-4-hydroxy-6-hydroxymethyldihydropteridine diphosphokinase [Chitinophaga japonensis]